MNKIVYDNKIFKSTDKELWRPVVGFPGYEISNHGRVKSFKSGKAKILKQRLNKDGYPIVDLYNEGIRYTEYVHRLVAKAFLGIPENNLEINHRNGVKTDNRSENLEWVTHAENIWHAVETGLKNDKGENNPRAKLTESEVLEILDMVDAEVPTCEIAEIFNVAPCTISNIKAGRSWKHLRNRSADKPRSKNPGQSTPITINLNFYFNREPI